MEELEKYAVDVAGSLGIAVDGSPESPDADFQEHEEPSKESVYTDDPVRVYLREMGSVRLLKRQGEIDLAEGMERGTLRMRKALSRSPLGWQRALALYADVREGTVRLEDFFEAGGPDDEAREAARTSVSLR